MDRHTVDGIPQGQCECVFLLMSVVNSNDQCEGYGLLRLRYRQELLDLINMSRDRRKVSPFCVLEAHEYTSIRSRIVPGLEISPGSEHIVEYLARCPRRDPPVDIFGSESNQAFGSLPRSLYPMKLLREFVESPSIR